MIDPLKYNVAEQPFMLETEWMKMIKYGMIE